MISVYGLIGKFFLSVSFISCVEFTRYYIAGNGFR